MLSLFLLLALAAPRISLPPASCLATDYPAAEERRLQQPTGPPKAVIVERTDPAHAGEQVLVLIIPSSITPGAYTLSPVATLRPGVGLVLHPKGSGSPWYPHDSGGYMVTVPADLLEDHPAINLDGCYTPCSPWGFAAYPWEMAP